MKRMRIVSTLLFFSLISLSPEVSHAYLDPGAGSIVLQLLLGGIAALGVAAKLFWSRIRAFFKPGKGERDEA